MNRKSLRQLYAEHTGKSSDKWSLYLAEYDRLFSEYRDKHICLLEIGIQNGGSLEIWLKYFTNAVTLVGCDINPDCSLLKYDDPKVNVIVGDANAPEVVQQVSQCSEQFDIIIDDGSHLSSDIVKSFALYFSRVADGGIFIAEDLHCSYWESFEGGLYYPYSSVSFFKCLSDVISHEHWGVPKARAEILNGIFAEYDCQIDEEILAQVHSVEFINSICVIRKMPAVANTLGRRIVTGSTEIVVSQMKERNDDVYLLDPVHNQSANIWSSRSAPTAEALMMSELALAAMREQKLTLEQQLTALENNVACMRSSFSWRITFPIRSISRVLKKIVSKTKRVVLWLISKPMGNTQTSYGPEVVTENISIPKTELRILLIQRAHNFYRRQMKHTRIGRAIKNQILKRGLITNSDLQASALVNDRLSVKDSSYTDAGQVETDAGVPGFHLSHPLNIEVSGALAARPYINVLIPSLRLKHMSGGPNTALLLASLLAEKGEYIRLISCDAPAEGEEMSLLPHMDGLLQRPVPRDRIELVDAFDRTKVNLIGANDLFFATAWWTAQIAKYAVRNTLHKSFIYLIQDFEPILHEGSTFQARALETYGLPHIPVINTHLLLDHMIREGAGYYADPEFASSALCFEPALDRGHYFVDSDKVGDSGKKVMLFYARPSARRNLFELGVVALRQAVASGAIDKDNWEIWAMGEKLESVALGGGVFLNPLPWMSFEDYAKRVRTADLLLSLMLSPHPSYPPLEMAASGKLVVTNSFSVKTTERLKAISPNIIVAEPVAESVAAALERAAGRINAGLPSYDPMGIVDLPSNWDDGFQEVVPLLLERIQYLREISSDSNQSRVEGYPVKPVFKYEAYRRNRLAYRRSKGDYQQIPGLLSFVTSAYNTAPEFLEELSSSVFLQDGGMQFEWFILDNGSTDVNTCHSLRKIARHKNVRLERVEKNLGIVGGMRYCLERSQGRYIMPLDSDDLIEPDCINVLSRFLVENDYPPLVYTDEDKLDLGRFGSPYFKPDWDPVLFVHSCYIAHLCVIDRGLALELDLYSDKTAEGCHDWNSFIRFMQAGYTPLHIPEVLYSWRMHEESTSGNIASKSYITESHRASLQYVLTQCNTQNLELVSSPLFEHNVDWWYRRKQDVPISCDSLLIVSVSSGNLAAKNIQPTAEIDASAKDSLLQLAHIVETRQSDLIHLCWNGVTPDNDEWRWDSAGLLELFGDAVMVGGTLHDGKIVVDGPRVFGFGNGYDCPDRGRLLNDCGYSAIMWKAHSVSAVSSGHCVIRRDFLRMVMPKLLSEQIEIELLGPWLGALAAEAGKRVVFSPFMRAKTEIIPEDLASKCASAHFLTSFWSQLFTTCYYSQHLGLTLETAYTPVSNVERDLHIKKLQQQTLPYSEWFARDLLVRAGRYPVAEPKVSLSIVTPVYNGSDLELLDALANSITSQTVPVFEWLLIVNGAMNKQSMDFIQLKAANQWGASVIVEPEAIGIVASLRMGLVAAKGEYIVPVDADDLITRDAVQILVHEIERHEKPELIYSDEDLLVDGVPSSPCLRGEFDAVLALENSTIWHLCAMKRESALELDVYGDVLANWCQDWDVVSRFANSAGRIVHVPEVLYHWRQHSGSTTNNEHGDSRSLQSVQYILERHIAQAVKPEIFYVEKWPDNRGSPELYIARKSINLPQFICIGEVAMDDIFCSDDAILVVTANGVVIDSEQVFNEVARLMELHPHVGAVGGIVEDKDGVIVDGCYMVNCFGNLESLWFGKTRNFGGPHALALKVQNVSTVGEALAFFRVSTLKEIGAWPLNVQRDYSDTVIQLCGRLAESNKSTVFSPLIRARTGSAFRVKESRMCPPAGTSIVNHALIRSGMCLNYRI